MLTVTGLSKRFGGLSAVQNLSFTVAEGEILAIIGPNGAGKTTTLNLLSGLLAPSEGSITLGGRDITGLGAAARCHAGLGRAFQIVQPFPEMSVFENILVGALFGKEGVSARQGRGLAEEALTLSGLTPLRDTPAESLTLMQEKRLEIARALATQPTVLLLDEVMAGLRAGEARQAVELVRQVQGRGVTIVFIEHVMSVVRDLADRVIVMNYGEKLVEGSYQEVIRNPQVIEAYLGDEAA